MKKYSGPDEIKDEYLKMSTIKLHVLFLSICFTLDLAHCYLPPAMIETTFVCIAKIHRIIVIIDPLHLLQLCPKYLSLFYY